MRPLKPNYLPSYSHTGPWAIMTIYLHIWLNTYFISIHLYSMYLKYSSYILAYICIYGVCLISRLHVDVPNVKYGVFL